ncbi:hypothetical protein HK097_005970 [Rhizophlyctis rosea]|uniref:C2H2-type domain-containing protein n=1 Tax=Rhizophlyctis rosea TaxID=64517 RepID=A0AAD5SJ61_9FUNG|nr:hypothetical protein HK097_005970 [Rhizophlyctis rosea]
MPHGPTQQLFALHSSQPSVHNTYQYVTPPYPQSPYAKSTNTFSSPAYDQTSSYTRACPLGKHQNAPQVDAGTYDYSYLYQTTARADQASTVNPLATPPSYAGQYATLRATFDPRGAANYANANLHTATQARNAPAGSAYSAAMEKEMGLTGLEMQYGGVASGIPQHVGGIANNDRGGSNGRGEVLLMKNLPGFIEAFSGGSSSAGVGSSSQQSSATSMPNSDSKKKRKTGTSASSGSKSGTERGEGAVRTGEHGYTTDGAILGGGPSRDRSTREEAVNLKKTHGRKTKLKRYRTAPHQPVACQVEGCGKVLSRPFNLKVHMKTHDPDRERPFACPTCSKTFVRQHDLARHCATHSDVRSFECFICGKAFVRKDALDRHAKISGRCRSGSGRGRKKLVAEE